MYLLQSAETGGEVHYMIRSVNFRTGATEHRRRLDEHRSGRRRIRDPRPTPIASCWV